MEQQSGGAFWRFYPGGFRPKDEQPEERAAQHPGLILNPPDEQQDDPTLPSMTGTGRRHQAVNTLAPNEEEIPETPEEQARYLAARAKFYHRPDINGPGNMLGPLPPSRSARSRWLASFRKLARRLTGREIDTRLLTEAERTRLVARPPAQTAIPLPPSRSGRSRWLARFRKLARMLTGRDIDTRDMTEAQRTEASRQLSAVERENMRQQSEKDREAARVAKWRLKPVKGFTPG